MRFWINCLPAVIFLVATGCGRSKVVQQLPSPSGKAQAIVKYEPGFADHAYIVLLESSEKKKELTAVSQVLHLVWNEKPETLSVFSTPAFWTNDTNVYEEIFGLNGAMVSKQIKGVHGEWKPPQHQPAL